MPHAVSGSCRRHARVQERAASRGTAAITVSNLQLHVGIAIRQLLRGAYNSLYLKVSLYWLFQVDESKLIHTLSGKKKKTVLDLHLWGIWIWCCRESITLTPSLGFPFAQIVGRVD